MNASMLSINHFPIEEGPRLVSENTVRPDHSFFLFNLTNFYPPRGGSRLVRVLSVASFIKTIHEQA